MYMGFVFHDQPLWSMATYYNLCINQLLHWYHTDVFWGLCKSYILLLNSYKVHTNNGLYLLLAYSCNSFMVTYLLAYLFKDCKICELIVCCTYLSNCKYDQEYTMKKRVSNFHIDYEIWAHKVFLVIIVSLHLQLGWWFYVFNTL